MTQPLFEHTLAQMPPGFREAFGRVGDLVFIVSLKTTNALKGLPKTKVGQLECAILAIEDGNNNQPNQNL